MARPTRRSLRLRRALTVDLWYTLLYLSRREQRRVAAARRALWLRHLRAVGHSRGVADRLLRDLERWGDAEHAAGRAPSLRRQADRLATRMGRRLPVRAIEREMDRIVLSARVRPAPGAARALRRLRRSGVALGLVSTVMFETGRATRTLLARHGMRDPFDVLVLSCERPRSKPSPEPVREALRRLGVRPGDAVHLGDDRFDLDAARTAGAHPMLFVGLERFRPVVRLRPPRPAASAVPVVRRWSTVDRALLDAVPTRFPSTIGELPRGRPRQLSTRRPRRRQGFL